MKALILTMFLASQGHGQLKCTKVTRDPDKFYHLRLVDRNTRDTWPIITDRWLIRIGRCGL